MHAIKEIKVLLAQKFNLSDDDSVEILPSGRQIKLMNYLSWTGKYLKKAGLL